MLLVNDNELREGILCKKIKCYRGNGPPIMIYLECDSKLGRRYCVRKLVASEHNYQPSIKIKLKGIQSRNNT